MKIEDDVNELLREAIERKFGGAQPWLNQNLERQVAAEVSRLVNMFAAGILEADTFVAWIFNQARSR